MKRYFTFLTAVILLMTLVSCAPKNNKNQGEVTTDTTSYKPIIMEESQPDTMASDTTRASVDTTIDTTNNANTSSAVTSTTTMGYRVQVFATFSENKADMIANQVRERTTEPVYVEYIAPYYKVRVGDCTTKDIAETLKSSLYGLGYSDAFVVQDTINPK